MLFTARNPGLDARSIHRAGNRLADLLDQLVPIFADLCEPRGDRLVRIGFQLLECEQLHLMHIFVHPDPLSEGGVDIHRFAGDTAALLRAFDEVQRAHIVQPIGKFDQQHTDIVGNRQQEFPQVFGRPLILGLRLDFRKLGDAIDQPRDFGSEPIFNVLDRGQRVFHGIVQKRGDDGVFVHLQLGH